MGLSEGKVFINITKKKTVDIMQQFFLNFHV